MAEEITVISRNPFTRTSIVRRTVRSSYSICLWCGSRGTRGKLYAYGEESDYGRTRWEMNLFCSKFCHDHYTR
jgi:hypothetical protein